MCISYHSVNVSWILYPALPGICIWSSNSGAPTCPASLIYLGQHSEGCQPDVRLRCFMSFCFQLVVNLFHVHDFQCILNKSNPWILACHIFGSGFDSWWALRSVPPHEKYAPGSTATSFSPLSAATWSALEGSSRMDTPNITKLMVPTIVSEGQCDSMGCNESIWKPHWKCSFPDSFPQKKLKASQKPWAEGCLFVKAVHCCQEQGCTILQFVGGPAMRRQENQRWQAMTVWQAVKRWKCVMIPRRGYVIVFFFLRTASCLVSFQRVIKSAWDDLILLFIYIIILYHICHFQIKIWECHHRRVLKYGTSRFDGSHFNPSAKHYTLHGSGWRGRSLYVLPVDPRTSNIT